MLIWFLCFELHQACAKICILTIITFPRYAVQCLVLFVLSPAVLKLMLTSEVALREGLTTG